MKRALTWFLILTAQTAISFIASQRVLSSQASNTYLPDRTSQPAAESGPSIVPPVNPEPLFFNRGWSAGPEAGRRPDGNAGKRGKLIASVPEIEYSGENIEETENADKVTVIGCDGSVWESAAISAGQADLAGTWAGNEQGRAGQLSITFTYSGRFELKAPDGEWHHGRYACDGRPDPKILNLYIKESSNSDFIGKTFRMIYKVESNKLTCASSEPGVNSRPGSFASGSGTRLFVFTKRN
jgi:hypothetical protein